MPKLKREMPEPYRIADAVIEKLSKRILNETAKTKRKLTVLEFDELNVMNETDRLYAVFARECRKALREIYRERYEEIWLWLKEKRPDEDELDEMLDLYLTELWDKPDERSLYAFGPELERKCGRAKDAVRAVPTKTQKQINFDKASRYLIQQCSWYCDFASQDAEWKAMKDAGIQKVKWNIYGDDRVCQTCFERDGKIYPIDKVPKRPHLRCRCWLSLV